MQEKAGKFKFVFDYILNVSTKLVQPMYNWYGENWYMFIGTEKILRKHSGNVGKFEKTIKDFFSIGFCQQSLRN